MLRPGISMSGLRDVGLPTRNAAEEEGELWSIARRDTAGVMLGIKIDGRFAGAATLVIVVRCAHENPSLHQNARNIMH